MVEAKIGPNIIFENDEAEESDVSDLVDDRAVPNISVPNPIHSTVSSWGWLGCDRILSWVCLGCDKISSWGWLGCDIILSWPLDSPVWSSRSFGNLNLK